MSTHCSQGQVASGRGLGGTDMARGCRATAAASVWPVGRGGAAWRIAERRGACGEVLQSGPKPWGPACRLGRVAAIRALWARPVHALNVLDEMPWHSRALGWSWDLAGWGYSLRQNHWTSWYDPRFKVTMQRQNHVKTGHAHQVFDKMPRALRHFLEWPKSPDQCLCG